MKSTNKVFTISILVGIVVCFGCSKSQKKINADQSAFSIEGLTNPIIDGYFADPSIVMDEGTFYVYATIDPWGGDSLALFKSVDFKNWERVPLNWPTKAKCTSPTSNDSRVWAPSVIKGLDGKFHMFVSVGSEVYAGISDSPEGPWRNVKTDNSPLISTQKADDIHTIDAEAFIDDDGQAYLYWGSGWDWEDGHLLVARMNESMTELTSETHDITPSNYFEAPYMLKRDGRYFMMYSFGKCIDETYQVRVSEAKTPFGPFTEIAESPILSTDTARSTVGAGHHTVMEYGGQNYILYHRIKDNNQTLLRELCIDSLNFDKHGNMMKVIPNGEVKVFVK
ncbi:MAG: family 43 glycosylhydrolase [Marinoscillum sp.]